MDPSKLKRATPQNAPAAPPMPSLERVEALANGLKRRRDGIAARERANLEAVEQQARAEFEARKEREGKEGPPDLSDLEKMLERFTAGKRVLTPAEEEAYFLRHRIQPQMEAWKFPERYWTPITHWDCPPQQTIFKICQRMCRNVGAVLALIGERGTGKTTIAAQLAIEFIREDEARAKALPERGGALKFRAVPYRKLNDLIAEFKPLYTDQGSIRMEELTDKRDKWLKSVDLLIIDEVHDCDDLKVKNRLLVDVIDRRYSACKDVILISNQTHEEFKAVTDDSIQSRISQHGMIIPCQWGSWRDRLSDTAAFIPK